VEPQSEKTGALFFIGATCSSFGLGSSPFFENPVSNETGFFVLDRRVRPSDSVRRLSLWSPSLKRLGFIFYWNEVFASSVQIDLGNSFIELINVKSYYLS
jgi:hypothetical protein